MANVIIKTDGIPFAIYSMASPKGVFEWNEKNGFTQSVPAKLETVDSFKGTKKVISENFAQHLLDNYPELQLDHIEEEPVAVQPVVRKRGRPKKQEETQ